MRSIAQLLGVEVAVPDFSTLSRRGNGLTLRQKPKPKSGSGEPVQLVVNSTGLKIYGEGDWCQKKHKTKRKRRSWRKLHLGLDLVSGEIICSDLTTDDIGGPTALPGLLGQVDGPVDLFLALFGVCKQKPVRQWTELTTENRHLICFPPGSDRRSRS